ncbi:hypothetical protein ACWD4F_21955 [Streptomyces aureus]
MRSLSITPHAAATPVAASASPASPVARTSSAPPVARTSPAPPAWGIPSHGPSASVCRVGSLTSSAPTALSAAFAREPRG